MAFLQIFITVNREKSGTVQSVLQRYDYRTAQNNQYESTAKVTQKTKRFIPDKGNQGIQFLVLYHEPGVVVTGVTKNLQHTNWKILFFRINDKAYLSNKGLLSLSFLHVSGKRKNKERCYRYRNYMNRESFYNDG